MSDDDYLPPRIASKILINPDTGCWEWVAYLNKQGYGMVSFGGRPQLAHRLIYTLLVGSIPDGLDLDHTCHSDAVARGQCGGGITCPHRRCVSPLHAEPVTRSQNLTRGVSARVRWAETHCPHGHEYTVENSHVRVDSGSRVCRECMRQRARERYYRLRQASA